jgi:hypothetical protein
VRCSAGLIGAAAAATLTLSCGAPTSLGADSRPPDLSPSPSLGATTQEVVRTPSPSHTPTPMPTPATVVLPPGSATLTDRDAGGVFQVRLGTTISVNLNWSTAGEDVNGPASSVPAVVVRTKVESASDHVTATFRSVGTGRAFLAADADPLCLRASPPCGESTRSWRVIVTVVP